MPSRAQRIGLDFDNTLICYDNVFCDAARARGLVETEFAGTKQEVRDAIRLLPDGEHLWQQLQGHVYGAAIDGARQFAGVDSFLARARERGTEIVIVSHKTQFGHFDPRRVNLREAARGWMKRARFFQPEGGAISETNVHFADTRAEKLAKIAELGCTLFIDDLEEVLRDPGFPPHVERILFSPRPPDSTGHPFVTLGDWRSIEEHVFGERRGP
jgi:hypothetical protein